MTVEQPKLFPYKFRFATAVLTAPPHPATISVGSRFSILGSFGGCRLRAFDPRLVAAIAAGKAAGMASRVLRAGGGTTLPGVVARRIAPDTLRRLSAALPQGVALVGGTNGKTTMTRMLAAILADDGRAVLHNRAGANLVTGLTATALGGSTL